MPKISGSNIAEHVVDQEAAVFEAATRLFAERSINEVSMGTIAEAVGLARPSLYRYFPTKSAIVFRWFDQVMTPLIQDSNAIAELDEQPHLQLDRWIECQMDFLADPGNNAMIGASVELKDFSDGQRATIGLRHKELYTSLDSILAAGCGIEGDKKRRARVQLIVALLRGFPDLVEADIGDTLARSELLRASRMIAGVEAR